MMKKRCIPVFVLCAAVLVSAQTSDEPAAATDGAVKFWVAEIRNNILVDIQFIGIGDLNEKAAGTFTLTPLEPVEE